MSFAALHKLVTYLYATLGFAALALGDQLSIVAVVALFFGMALSALAEGPILDAPSYVRGWNVAMVAFLGLQVARGFFTEVPVLTLGVEFAGVLQLSRLASRRSVDEHRHVAALGFLHLIAATVLSTELSYGFLFFGFVVATPWMLALTHLRGEIEKNFAGSIGDGHAAFRRLLESRELAGPGFLLGTVALSVPLFLVTAAFFLLFPRVGMGFLSFGAETGERVSGFSDQIDLGGFGVIRDDPSVVLRVTPANLPENPPASARLRLRGTAFDHYEDGRWSRSLEGGQALEGGVRHFPLIRRFRPGRDIEHTIVLDAIDPPVLFLPAGTVAIEVPPRVERGFERPRDLALYPGMDVRYQDSDGLDMVYSAWVDPTLPGIPDELGEVERERYLQLPRRNSRIRRLSRRVTRDAEGARAKAHLLESFFRDSREFHYSLELPDTEGGDPLDVFLFEARRGHCEYYSSAMAVMLRTMGIPSRNVTGFVGGQWNPYGGFYTLRNGDAHSWVEAYIDGHWITFDPTPPIRHRMGPQPSPLSGARAMLDALRVRWARYVVGYDLRAQVEGLRAVWSFFRSFRSGEGSRGRGDVGGASEAGPDEGERALLHDLAFFFVGAVLLVVLGLLASALFRRFRRERSPRSRESALLEALDRAMGRLGYARLPSETPREWERRLRHEGLEEIDVVEAVVSAHERARYGGRPLGDAEAQSLAEAIASLRSRPAEAGRRAA